MFADGREQLVPQAPQLVALLRVSISHPLAGLPSQLPRPDAHTATVQIPDSQPGVPNGTVHPWPQVPQCVVLVVVFTSHPLAEFPSQSAKPASQRNAHAPPTQLAAACGVIGHTLAHRPQ